jgi:hypothetical protein
MSPPDYTLKLLASAAGSLAPLPMGHEQLPPVHIKRAHGAWAPLLGFLLAGILIAVFQVLLSTWARQLLGERAMESFFTAAAVEACALILALPTSIAAMLILGSALVLVGAIIWRVFLAISRLVLPADSWLIVRSLGNRSASKTTTTKVPVVAVDVES